MLVTTKGFADILQIGRQDRPALYDLSMTRPTPLVSHDQVVTVAERISATGEVLVELTQAELERVVRRAKELAPQSIAVSLLFSYARDEHEQRICDALAGIGVPITRSSELLPEFREYERTSTCVLNAAVQPVMQRYLSNLSDRLPDPTITVMTSGGGNAGLQFAAAAPVHTLLSGPAAGVVAASAIACATGYEDAIAFDMGGTSTDVCLIKNGDPQVSTEAEIGGLPFRTPAVGVHTVGAGGGSIAWMDKGGALRVGPRSAGADPGPACYGRGGTEPTVTDAHCVLGHLGPDRQLGGGLRLDRELAARAIRSLPKSAEGAEGILSVIRATMTRALRTVSTERGVDPAGLALIAYGGAGPLHATALARELGCGAVIVPPAPGVLSALGLLLAPPRFEASRTVMCDAGEELESLWNGLEADAHDELQRQGASGALSLTRIVDARYAGQSHELRIEVTGGMDVAELFHRAHRSAYGYSVPAEQVRIVTARVVARGNPIMSEPPSDWDQGEPRPECQREIGISGAVRTVRVVSRAALSSGDRVTGPALIEQGDTTTLLGFGEAAFTDDAGNLVIGFTGTDGDG